MHLVLSVTIKFNEFGADFVNKPWLTDVSRLATA